MQPNHVQLPSGPLPWRLTKETPGQRVKGSPQDILALALVRVPVSPLHSDVLLWPRAVGPFLHFLSILLLLSIIIYTYVPCNVFD